MAKTKWRRRDRVCCEERIQATPETMAKLQPDPLLALVRGIGRGDVVLESAADEIRAVYMAVVRGLMRKGGLREDRGGMPDIPPFLAWAHAETYLPWARAQLRQTMQAVIDVVVDRQAISNGCPPEAVVWSLHSYADRMMRRPSFRVDN